MIRLYADPISRPVDHLPVRGRPPIPPERAEKTLPTLCALGSAMCKLHDPLGGTTCDDLRGTGSFGNAAFTPRAPRDLTVLWRRNSRGAPRHSTAPRSGDRTATREAVRLPDGDIQLAFRQGLPGHVVPESSSSAPTEYRVLAISNVPAANDCDMVQQLMMREEIAPLQPTGARKPHCVGINDTVP